MVMIQYNMNPTLLNLGQLQIRYYGLFYVLGFILAYFILIHLSKQRKIKFSKQKIEDLLVYLGIAGILGARLGYILIYNLEYYLSNPGEILAVWHGGLSFHGAFIGALIGIYLFARKNKMDYLMLLDLTAIPFALALALGRIGNFINGELFGKVTNLPWCVKFDDFCRHPSQLYESAKNLVIFFTLWELKNKKMRKGMLATIFILMYSVLRFIIEFFREPDSQIGYIYNLTIGQWLCIAMLVFGIILYIKIKRK